MKTEIIWHGHSNFQINSGGVSVLIDPFFEGNPVCSTNYRDIQKPDIVLVTHDHGDHVGDAIRICNQTQARCVCVYDTAPALIQMGLAPHLLGAAHNIGGTAVVKGVKITMTVAVHTSETGAPIGYVVEMPDGFTFYHAGDTGLFGDMALIGEFHELDLALLPVGGVYTMDAKQAVYASKLLKPKRVIPMHYKTFPFIGQTPDEFVELMAKSDLQAEVIVMEPNGKIEL